MKNIDRNVVANHWMEWEHKRKDEWSLLFVDHEGRYSPYIDGATLYVWADEGRYQFVCSERLRHASVDFFASSLDEAKAKAMEVVREQCLKQAAHFQFVAENAEKIKKTYIAETLISRQYVESGDIGEWEVEAE